MTSSIDYPLARTTPNERLASMLAHGGTLFAWFLAPLVIWIFARKRSPVVAEHAMQALIWSGLGTLVAFLTCGLAVPVFLVFHLIVAWRAWQGRGPNYPALSDFMRGWR